MAPIGLEDADLVLKLVRHPHAAQRIQCHANDPAEGGRPLLSRTAADPYLLDQTPLVTIPPRTRWAVPHHGPRSVSVRVRIGAARE
jgi:hypothetical protein